MRDHHSKVVMQAADEVAAMCRKVVIIKVLAVDDQGRPIEYLAYEVPPAFYQQLTNRLHQFLMRVHQHTLCRSSN